MTVDHAVCIMFSCIELSSLQQTGLCVHDGTAKF